MAKQPQKWPFCEQGYSQNDLHYGHSITVGRLWRYQGDKANFKPFLGVPIKELEQRLKNSQAEEKKVFEAIKRAVEAWDEHGAQTLLLQKAIEYVKVPEVKHTGNEWKKRKDGSWEISNLTYRMTFSIEKAGPEWKLAWELFYMAPGLGYGYWEYSRSPKNRIEYEGSKKYKTMDGAQKYVQSKFDQYAECFSELCPPVPEEAKPLFSVNGQLLPAYKLKKAKVVEPMEKTVSRLLDCLEEDIAEGPLNQEKPLAEPPTAKEEAPGKPRVSSESRKKPSHKKKPSSVR